VNRSELLRRISTFPLLARQLSQDIAAGAWRSVFKGQGMEFDEVRLYQSGDDVRAIDWNVSARFARPYIKQFREERELSTLIVLDCSASMRGGGALTRHEQAVLITGLLSFSAIEAGGRVGALFFSSGIDALIKPGHGRSRAMAITCAALDAAGSESGSNLSGALDGARQLLKRRSLVFVLSDFSASGWERSLRALAAEHDVLAIRVGESVSPELPSAGLVRLRDPESSELVSLASSRPSAQAAWLRWREERAEQWHYACKRAMVPALDILEDSEPAKLLSAFFRSGRRV
jgi:uncharacterized protein (DUF58 family)